MQRIIRREDSQRERFFYNVCESLLSLSVNPNRKNDARSLKRALDLVSPVHGQFPPPDAEAKSLERYRLHSKVDEDEKNLVTKPAVVKGVLLQQTLQAIVSVILFKLREQKRKAVVLMEMRTSGGVTSAP